MHPVVAYLTCARESFPLLLCFVLCVQASAQVAESEGVQYRRDEKGRAVALNYWGPSGLVVPKDVSKLENVYIAYGTKLSADDIVSLSTLENVTDLTLGGVMSAESVYIEGSLDELTKLKRLRRLSFCKHRLQDDDLAFVSKLPKLQHLELYADLEGDRGTLLTDRCAEFLSRAKTLQSIYIYSGERLTDKFVDVIPRCRNAQALVLAMRNRLSRLPASWILGLYREPISARCRTLKSLHVGNEHHSSWHLAAKHRLPGVKILASGRQ